MEPLRILGRQALDLEEEPDPNQIALSRLIRGYNMNR